MDELFSVQILCLISMSVRFIHIVVCINNLSLSHCCWFFNIILRHDMNISFSCEVLPISFCDPMGCCRPSGSFIHEIFQTRIMEWVAISVSRGSSRPRGQTCTFRLAGEFSTTEPPRKPNRCMI